MAPNDQKTEVVSPTEVPEDLPLPSDPKVIFLGCLFVLAVLAAAYVAREIVLPFVFAIVLKLLLQPAFRMLERLHVPRTIASLLLILTLFGTIVGLGAAISGPARTWAAKLPEGIPRLQERLSFMREPPRRIKIRSFLTSKRLLQGGQDVAQGTAKGSCRALMGLIPAEGQINFRERSIGKWSTQQRAAATALSRNNLISINKSVTFIELIRRFKSQIKSFSAPS